jgi:hypothetical protein
MITSGRSVINVSEETWDLCHGFRDLVLRPEKLGF